MLWSDVVVKPLGYRDDDHTLKLELTKHINEGYWRIESWKLKCKTRSCLRQLLISVEVNNCSDKSIMEVNFPPSDRPTDQRTSRHGLIGKFYVHNWNICLCLKDNYAHLSWYRKGTKRPLNRLLFPYVVTFIFLCFCWKFGGYPAVLSADINPVSSACFGMYNGICIWEVWMLNAKW